MPRRLALLIGNTKFCQEDAFPQLSAPERDVAALSEVLEKYGHFEILARLINKDADTIRTAIEDLYDQTSREDLTLLYYSGHGRRDSSGRLFLAANNTQTSHLLSTGVNASFIREAQAASRTRHSIIILDCCYSGAFLPGEKGGSDLAIDQLKGEAAAILTSSGRVQPSFEGQNLNSIFTQTLVEGIRSGEADQDGDGWVEIGELFDYVKQRVKQEQPEQTPMLNLTARDSAIFIAETPAEIQQARQRQQRLQELFNRAQLAAERKDYQEASDLLSQIESQQTDYPGLSALRKQVNDARLRAEQLLSLPPELLLAIASPLAGVRFGAVQELISLLHSGHPGLAKLAEQALQNLEHDDSQRVSSAAVEALKVYRRSVPPAPLEQVAGVEPVSAQSTSDQPAQPAPVEKVIVQPVPAAPPKSPLQSQPLGSGVPLPAEVPAQPAKTPGSLWFRNCAIALGLLAIIGVIFLIEVMANSNWTLTNNPHPDPTPRATVLSPGSTSRAISPAALQDSSANPTQALAQLQFSGELPALAGTPVSIPTETINPQNGNRLQNLARWERLGNDLSSVVFSPDGQMLASGSFNNTIKLWRVSDGTPLRLIAGHTASIDTMAFSPDGQMLASGSMDTTIKLWHVSDGNLVYSLSATAAVTSVAFSPDGQILASGLEDNSVRLWRINDGSPLRTVQGHGSAVQSIAFSPDGKILAGGSMDNTIKLWRVSDGSQLGTLTGYEKGVSTVEFSPDGTLLAGGSYDGTIKLWRVSDSRVLQTLTGQPFVILSVAFSPDGQILASGSSNQSIKIWRVSDGSLLQTLTGQSNDVTGVSFSPDGKLLVSASRDASIFLWGIYP